MFDIYRVQSAPSHISATQTITEKRAPTDESVRLLREMENSARKEVIKAVKVDGAVFDAVLHERRDQMSGTTTYLCIFNLNGQKMTAEFEAKDWDDMEKRAIGIRDAIARQVANAIAAPVMKTMTKNFHTGA